MDVAILGASGDCGREIASQLVASRLLAPTERMQMVGRAEGASARVLYGLAADLADAHAEYIPEVDVALDPSEVVADLWVVACGRTIEKNGPSDRNMLAESNGPIFAAYADALARYGQGSEIAIIVSNPVELGVAIFAEAIGRHRVIGIGAFQDSLRFRREIASDLGVRRQRVSGFMLGEHGVNQVPLWSSVGVYGMARGDVAAAIRNLRRGTEAVPFDDMVRDGRDEMTALIAGDDIAGAFRRLESLPPDLRVVLKPIVTHLSGAKTVMATANVTIELLKTLLGGHEALIAAQVVTEPEEYYGLKGPLGVPIIVGPQGVLRVVETPVTSDELQRLTAVSRTVAGHIDHWMAKLGKR
ncbi:MAG: hypothetical protein SFU56_06355 [Capsulimonadales bacterium]|nr:hypothetical protein [Capsulimonadales bacterium]